jgi:hypothetical protein
MKVHAGSPILENIQIYVSTIVRSEQARTEEEEDKKMFRSPSCRQINGEGCPYKGNEGSKDLC